MRPNPLRAQLSSGAPTIGARVHSSWPGIVETIGHAGTIDYAEFLGEYAPFDLGGLDDFCRAAELHGLGTMLKVDQEPRTFLAQRAVGAGFDAILFADCRSADDARACIAAVRAETPDTAGTYGVAGRRRFYPSYGGTPAYVQALEDVVVALMIEKRGAVDDLERILELPGLDLVQFGRADYAMSIGRPGAGDGDEVRAVERHVIEACLERGIAPRAELGSVEDAERYLELGVRQFSIGVDLTILFRWWSDQGARLRELVGAAGGVGQ
jgi:4-hydroxy-2-oxoheptanedioate aldolase